MPSRVFRVHFVFISCNLFGTHHFRSVFKFSFRSNAVTHLETMADRARYSRLRVSERFYSRKKKQTESVDDSDGMSSASGSDSQSSPSKGLFNVVSRVDQPKSVRQTAVKKTNSSDGGTPVGKLCRAFAVPSPRVTESVSDRKKSERKSVDCADGTSLFTDSDMCNVSGSRKNGVDDSLWWPTDLGDPYGESANVVSGVDRPNTKRSTSAENTPVSKTSKNSPDDDTTVRQSRKSFVPRPRVSERFYRAKKREREDSNDSSDGMSFESDSDSCNLSGSSLWPKRFGASVVESSDKPVSNRSAPVKKKHVSTKRKHKKDNTTDDLLNMEIPVRRPTRVFIPTRRIMKIMYEAKADLLRYGAMNAKNNMKCDSSLACDENLDVSGIDALSENPVPSTSKELDTNSESTSCTSVQPVLKGKFLINYQNSNTLINQN